MESCHPTWHTPCSHHRSSWTTTSVFIVDLDSCHNKNQELNMRRWGSGLLCMCWVTVKLNINRIKLRGVWNSWLKCFVVVVVVVVADSSSRLPSAGHWCKDCAWVDWQDSTSHLVACLYNMSSSSSALSSLSATAAAEIYLHRRSLVENIEGAHPPWAAKAYGDRACAVRWSLGRDFHSWLRDL